MKKEKGQALVEFSLMLVVLLAILVFIFGAVFVVHNYLVLDRAVAKAVRQGAVGATNNQMVQIINAITGDALVNTPLLAGRFYSDQIHIEIYDADGAIVSSGADTGGRDDYDDVHAKNRLKLTLFYEVYFALPYISGVFNTRIPISETICIEQPVGGWYPH
ncbi:pilus assembly protein [Patescibacteria group bacterium]|nr:pilus assembly protein [Patescibacteria group bacterium]MBU1684572.1 pilus assembly protein [Patescibacteria group bacterium]MBU1987830.1 pilus assembly protein [Patescibacteria group bacterium]